MTEMAEWVVVTDKVAIIAQEAGQFWFAELGTHRACSPLKTRIPVQRPRAQLSPWLPVQLSSASACQLIRRHPPALGREST